MVAILNSYEYLHIKYSLNISTYSPLELILLVYIDSSIYQVAQNMRKE